MVKAFEAAGLDVNQARGMVVKLAAEIAGDKETPAGPRVAALGILVDRLFPKSRPLDPGQLRGARSAQDAHAKLLAAVAAGVMSPDEAVAVGRQVDAWAEAGEWERLRAVQESIRTLPAAAPSPTAGPGRGRE